jgi:hypothetical protein
MSDEQLVVVADLVAATAGEDLQGLRERLYSLAKRVWLPGSGCRRRC